MSQGRRRSQLPSNWPAIRATVLERDSHQCQLRYRRCTGRATEVDHMAGPDNHASEFLQAACHRCHASKTGHDANQARQAKYDRKRLAEPHPGVIDAQNPNPP